MLPGNLHYRYIDLYFTTATIKGIHRNPIQAKWQLSSTSAAYLWSSAAFYDHADLQWPFLTHFWYGDDWPPPMEFW